VERDVQRFIHRDQPGRWVEPGEISRQTLVELQSSALGVLRPLAKDQEQRLGIAGDLVLSFWVMRNGTGGPLQIVTRGSSIHRFLYQIVRVLEGAGVERLRACPECAQLFVKVTKKQFCSVQCQSRVYMRKYRAGEVGGE
jgi:hypothetical protein